MNAPMIPSGAPSVVGSPRTFTCVEVVPSTGIAVGGSVGGGTVGEAGGAIEGARVAVIMKGVAASSLGDRLREHPLAKNASNRAAEKFARVHRRACATRDDRSN